MPSAQPLRTNLGPIQLINPWSPRQGKALSTQSADSQHSIAGPFQHCRPHPAKSSSGLPTSIGRRPLVPASPLETIDTTTPHHPRAPRSHRAIHSSVTARPSRPHWPTANTPSWGSIDTVNLTLPNHHWAYPVSSSNGPLSIHWPSRSHQPISNIHCNRPPHSIENKFPSPTCGPVDEFGTTSMVRQQAHTILWTQGRFGNARPPRSCWLNLCTPTPG